MLDVLHKENMEQIRSQSIFYSILKCHGLN